MKPVVFGRNGVWYVKIGTYPPGYTTMCFESWFDAIETANRLSGGEPSSLLGEWLRKAMISNERTTS